MAPAAWRKSKKHSLRDVAAMLGTTANSVRRYERGIREAPTSIGLKYELISDGAVTSEDLHAVRTKWRRANESKKAA